MHRGEPAEPEPFRASGKRIWVKISKTGIKPLSPSYPALKPVFEYTIKTEEDERGSLFYSRPSASSFLLNIKKEVAMLAVPRRRCKLGRWQQPEKEVNLVKVHGKISYTIRRKNSW